MACGFLPLRRSLKRCTVNHKNVRPTIVVVIEESHPAASGLDYVLFPLLSACNSLAAQPHPPRDVNDVHFRRIRWGILRRGDFATQVSVRQEADQQCCRRKRYNEEAQALALILFSMIL